ncbi:MAG: putative protease / nuclease, EndA/NucM family [candidate division NC10 bacterium]|nr:putative protease / nuclease, EndA/NucM family [candidate division NC10 bacterium]
MEHAEKQKKVAAFAKQIATPGGRLESLRSEENPMYAWLERAKATDEERDVARRAVEKVSHDEELTPPETETLEAIVLPEGRPALDIVDGRYDPPLEPWSHLDQPEFRRLIEAAIPSIGRVEVPDHPTLPYAGTGFIVGDGLLMTNRHVAEIFVLGLGIRELRFRPGLDSSGVDFRRELGSRVSEFFEIEKVLMVHPYWDMALFRVEGLSAVHGPLVLEAVPAKDLCNQDVVVIGYPAQDPRNDPDLQDRIFRRRYRVKRLQPGQLTGTAETRSFGHNVTAMTHNSSTLGGNSGSAVVNVKTGRVVGLHFGGVYLEANYAVPAYELSRDGHVVDAGVSFTETHPGVPLWKAYWDRAQEATPSRLPLAADRGPRPAPSRGEGGTGAVEIVVPLTVSITVDAPVRGGQARLVVDRSARAVAAATGIAKAPTTVDVGGALARARATESLPYYHSTTDRKDRKRYYQEMPDDADAKAMFDVLHQLLLQTHSTRPRYQPTVQVYPWVDRQENGRLRSLYSMTGRSFTFDEILALDEQVERLREERLAELPLEVTTSEEVIEAIEAALPFNCEHVVPQSWFGKREPMRGDLHHLFACESGCNSFRGNRAYFSFPEEAIREDCGRAEANKFEPGAGKGAAARATFYFLVRYPKLLSRVSEFPADRLKMLLRWHDEDPVSTWERHRNRAIFAVQGNRNPFIDFPEWAHKVDFRRGLSGATDQR